MNTRLHAGTFLLLVLIRFSLPAQKNYTSYVNPFIGTGGHGHTFPGAVLPFGMVQLSPDTRVDGSWDGSSGYHYSDSIIYGFSHTHLSGTGCSDWGDILLMPTAERTMENKLYASPFSHSSETAHPGFYSVTLSKSKIKAELTATLRTGIHRYSFPGNDALLILDLLHRDKTLDCSLRMVDSVTLTGYRISSAWAKEQRVYFAMRFSKPVKSMQLANNKQLLSALQPGQRAEGACLQFDAGRDKTLLVKVAISSVDEKGALKNLEAEAPHWDFNAYREAAEKAWNGQLGKVDVEEADTGKLKVFYTALYHCFIHPSLYMDVDRRYRGRDNQIHLAEDFTNYSVFSLWDTYRALNPLFTILEPARTTDFINSFLGQYRQAGRLPMWELSGNETDCMISFHSVSVIADAMLKGIKGFDEKLAYQAMKAASNHTAYGMPMFNKKGFLQVDDESESVSKTLEYAYDNWCVSQVSRLLGEADDAALYLKRSMAYVNLYDASTGFMRPRKNGGWLDPFSPAEVNNHFTEGNSWQYSFYVPQDVDGLIKLHGGKQAFEKKLDELFTTKEENKGRDQADVTGLIGQYAHGNEPSHHMAYLYTFAGKHQKAGAQVRRICREFYTNAPDGLIGNEDCGQMSAWYVFSAMGMYPVCPGQPQYILGAPMFKRMSLHLENGKLFSVTAAAPDRDVTGILMNNRPGVRSAINHNFIMNGGSLAFTSDSSSSIGYGRGIGIPTSVNNDVRIVPAPLIVAPRVFTDKALVSISATQPGSVFCVYTLDGSEPVKASRKYTQPFFIDATTTVKARTFTGNDSSATNEGTFHRQKYNYGITLMSPPNRQYAAEGPVSLNDGVMGSTDWRKGDWLGFQGRNMECVVDLGKKKKISRLGLNCLQDTRSWIVFPIRVNFYGSSDNKNFTWISSVEHSIEAGDYTVQLHHFEKKLEKPQELRYVKIVAENYGRLPDWHEGKGGDAFIFTDELEVK